MTNQEIIEALKNTGDFMIREQGMTPPDAIGMAIEHIERLDKLIGLMINMSKRPGYIQDQLKREARQYVEKKNVETPFVSELQ